ncbi:MAG: rod shape-determining protein RodA [Thermoanaerobaculia bacterium]|nr:rod shape-determining protein RodA [Thermoanaerobaculia bacterium]
MRRISAHADEPLGLLLRLGSVRWGLLVAALLLMAIGLATVHSASSELAVDYLPRQAAWIGVGLLVMLVVFSIDYQLLIAFAWPLYGLSLVSLVLVLVVGHEAGGARSWLGVAGFGGQPAEFAKLATVLVLASYLAEANRKVLSIPQTVLASVITLGPMVLIALESDLGSAAMFVPLAGGMLAVSGLRGRVVVAGLLVVALVGGLVWSFAMQDYQKQRVRSFVSPESDPLGAGYQLKQSKIAVGSGELLGRGYMQGTQSQLRFLPARHTDFVMAVLAEEWGFVGVAVVLFLYAIYFLNGAEIAMRARDRAGVLLVVGLLSAFGFHVLYNTSMVIGLVPITGIPLPLLSYGGSFMIANLIAVGLILGVDFRRHVNR